ncbi:hypothetical protein LPY66_04165 [Dehalobacter sp. DCM]|uniref:hypothetical protein n=1 Tax=Dehalobacter sp. DCM TaxID=2907827 RepID=UPI0030820A62|nr:hypothetical protein LPY66_04165 [Dehalobacter sp. DCM]
MKIKDNNKTSNIQVPQNVQEGLPYFTEIMANWVANQSHCDEKSPSKRKSFIAKNIKFSEEWTGSVGLLNYYLFHNKNNYVPGKSFLKRINPNLGFSPENCVIVHKNEVFNTHKKSKPKREKKDSIVDNEIKIVPTNNSEELLKILFELNLQPTTIIMLASNEGRRK